MTIDIAAMGGLLPNEIIMRLYTDADTTANLDRCSLILIPVDEYHFFADRRTAFVADQSRWGAVDTDLAQIGSVQFVKAMNRTNFIVSPLDSPNEAQVRFTTRANGPMILQNNSRQRLYFLFLQEWDADEDEYNYVGEKLVLARFLHNPRYLGMRGSS
jgi:hypothetical protein